MSKREYLFAEKSVDTSFLERFSQEMSAYFEDEDEATKKYIYSTLRRKLLWHIKHSLSGRQSEALLLILNGKTERETAAIMGISQQVVHIYKSRAINKLKEKFVP